MTPVIAAAQQLLDSAGYSREQQVLDYPVWLDRGDTASIELVAFVWNSPRDTTTADRGV